MSEGGNIAVFGESRCEPLVSTDSSYENNKLLPTDVANWTTQLIHELSQPLSAILNYTEGSLRRLRESGAVSGEILAGLDAATKQALRAGEILQRARVAVDRHSRMEQ